MGTGLRRCGGVFLVENNLSVDAQSLQRLQPDANPRGHLAAVAERQAAASPGEESDHERADLSSDPERTKAGAPYSHVVEADGWLFVTGQLATDPYDDLLPVPEGIEAQTRKVMDNLKRALAGAGVGFEDVVCVRIFLTEFERDYAAFNRLYTEYFRLDRLPARTTVGVTHLARGGIVEVDLIARRS